MTKIISGRIKNVREPDHTNQWDVHYQDIEVEAPEYGQFWGRIGTKKPYTENDIGQQGQWQLTEGQQLGDYKLKKYFPPRNTQQNRQQASQGKNSNKDVDWEAIAEGKVRHGVVCAYIESGREPNVQDVEKWVKYIMHSKQPWESEAEQARSELADDFDKRMTENIPATVKPWMDKITEMQVAKAKSAGVIAAIRPLTEPETKALWAIVYGLLGHWPMSEDDVKNIYDRIKPADFIQKSVF